MSDASMEEIVAAISSKLVERYAIPKDQRFKLIEFPVEGRNLWEVIIEAKSEETFLQFTYRTARYADRLKNLVGISLVNLCTDENIANILIELDWSNFKL